MDTESKTVHVYLLMSTAPHLYIYVLIAKRERIATRPGSITAWSSTVLLCFVPVGYKEGLGCNRLTIYPSIHLWVHGGVL